MPEAEVEPLSVCGDDIRKTGHVELLMLADQIVIAVLKAANDSDWEQIEVVVSKSREYQAMRMRAASQALAAYKKLEEEMLDAGG